MGRFELSSGISAVTQVGGVKLLRATACVQVKSAAATAANGLNDFEIEGITVSGGADHGYLAPVYCTGAVNTPTTTHPSGGPFLDYQKGWSYGVTPSLYIYERDCSPADYMGVVIKAKYKEKSSYYKVVITDTNGNPLDIIRNHRYIITVTAVNGYGHTTSDAAVDATPSNALKVLIEDVSAEFPCIVADGNSHTAMTNNVFTLYGKSAGAVELCTVYSSRGIQPEIDIPGGVNWLGGIASVTPIGSNKYKIMVSFSSGVDVPGSVLSTTVGIKCDNISQELLVRWTPVVLSASSDGNSYVIDLIEPTDRNWVVQIPSPAPAWLALHSTDNSAGSFPGGNGMVTELYSKYSAHAYLHVSTGTSGLGVVLKSSTSSAGETIANRIVISQ